jgi:oligopeptidase A
LKIKKFGKVIQTLLTQTQYTDLSDCNSVESDAFGLSQKLFDRLLYVPEVMNLISAHKNTGEPLPIDMLERLKQG